MTHAQQLDSIPVAPVLVDTLGMAAYENIVKLHAFDAAYLWLLRLQVVTSSILYDNQLQRSAAALKLAMLKSNTRLFNSATPTVQYKGV